MKHHTWTDWDWSDANWELSDVQKISDPTSLKFTAAGLTINLCNLPDALNLPEGKLKTFWYHAPSENAILHFRNQEPDGGASFTNCYWVKFSKYYTTLYRRVNNVDTQLAQWAWTLIDYTWFIFSSTWWIYKEPYQPDAIRIRIQIFNAAGDPLKTYQHDDSANQWAGSSVNRTGLAGQLIATSTYYDDTEIWKPQ